MNFKNTIFNPAIILIILIQVLLIMFKGTGANLEWYELWFPTFVLIGAYILIGVFIGLIVLLCLFYEWVMSK